MNTLHVKILELLKEIDEICVKYGITYYAAGGTAIGAARHKGFIPWDDDVDIYMTRSEFARFREAFKCERPRGRMLECLEDNEEYPGTIPRYINIETTDLCRFHCMNTCAGGILIDIFILDPVPSDPVLQEEYRDKLSVYADYTMPYYAFSYRNNTSNLDFYFKYKELEKKEGRQAVIKTLEEELFSFNEEDCEYYMLRWATLPSIFPKEMFGMPERFEFESLTIPMPEQWYRYLKQLYGFDWLNVPQSVENQDQHISVINTELPYENYTVEIDEFIDKKEARANYFRRKELLLKREMLDRPMQEEFLSIKAKAIAGSVSKRYNSDLLIQDQATDSECRKFLEKFDFYLLSQLSVPFAGKMKHGNWYRYRNPVLIPVPDGFIADVIYCLIREGEIKKAERLLEIRDKNRTSENMDETENPRIEDMRELLRNIDALWESYYCGKWDDTERIISRLGDKINILPIAVVTFMFRANIDVTNEFVHELEAILERYPYSGELLKAYADHMYINGRYEEAFKIYRSALAKTSNGILEHEISERLGETVDVHKETNSMCYNFGESYTANIHAKQIELLSEIDDICNKNDISYSLAGNTALYALHEHRLPPSNYICTVMMTPSDAARFIDAFEYEGKPDRRLDHMMNNCEHIGDDMYYAASDAVYVNLKTLYNAGDGGYFVRIIVLRREGIGGIKKIISGILEMIRTANCNVNKIIKPWKRSFVKTVSGLLMNIVGRERVARVVFSDILNDVGNGGYSVYSRKRVRNRATQSYPVDLFSKLVSVDVDGHQFRIVKCAEEFFGTEEDVPDIVGNTILTNPLWIYADSDVSVEELSSLLDIQKIWESEKWQKHLLAKGYSRQIKTLNRKIADYWQILLRADDRICLHEKYIEMRNDIIKAANCNDNDALGVMFEELDEKVKEYAERGWGFYFDSDIFDLYYEWLEAKGEESEVYKQMVPDYYRRPIHLKGASDVLYESKSCKA